MKDADGVCVFFAYMLMLKWWMDLKFVHHPEHMK